MENGIYVGPKQPPELLDAVRAGGGTLTELNDASAIIWYGGTPAEFPALKHDNIRWVQLPNAGVENWFDAKAITTDAVFTCAAGCYASSVAEHALALMLAGARRLHESLRSQTWEKQSPSTMRGTTVSIIGAGGIGLMLIDLLKPLGVDVLAVTRSGREVPGASASYSPDALHEVLSKSDYVVLAMPATDETRAVIGADELAAMKSTAWLVNVGRGRLVDTDAVVDALKNNQIGGAALDVTDPEPLPDGHPLWTLPNAIITPHSANSESLLIPELAKRVKENTEHFLADEPLVAVVDPGRGY